MTATIRCFHVHTEQGHVYGVAAHGKTEAKLMVQARLSVEETGDRPTKAEDFGSWPGVPYGTVLNYH